VPGLSDNIRVKSIVGRFLEHSRIFVFANGERLPHRKAKVYISSADWMPRNLDRRIEAAVPVDDPAQRRLLRQTLELMWSDNRQAWELQPDGTWIQRRPAEGEPEVATHRVLVERVWG